MKDVHKAASSTLICSTCGSDMVCSDHGLSLPCEMCEIEGSSTSSLCSRCGGVKSQTANQAGRLALLDQKLNPQPARLTSLLNLAEAGDASAQYSAAMMYWNGAEVAKNKVAAVKWCRLAANQGYAEAEYFLAKLFSKGDGIRRSAPDALKWFIKAANQNMPEAQYELAMLLMEGQGAVRQNHEAAERWLQLAASQGYKKAIEALKAAHREPVVETRDDVRRPRVPGKISDKSPAMEDTDSPSDGMSVWTVLKSISFGTSLIAGFFIGEKFWLAAFIAWMLIYLFRKSDSGLGRFGGAIVGSVIFSGLFFLVIRVSGIMPAAKLPMVVESMATTTIAPPAKVTIQPKASDALRVALPANELTSANTQFPQVVTAYLTSKNLSRESFKQLLASSFELAKRDMAANRQDEAQKVLVLANEELLNNRMTSTHSSQKSGQIQCQITSMLADLFLRQKNYPDAILAARKTLSTRLSTPDHDAKIAVNNAHLVLANTLLLTKKSGEAAREYRKIQSDILPVPDKLFKLILERVANTQAKNHTNQEVDTKKLFATYTAEEIKIVMLRIKDIDSENTQASSITKVAEHFVEENSPAPSILSKLSGIFKFSGIINGIEHLPASWYNSIKSLLTHA